MMQRFALLSSPVRAGVLKRPGSQRSQRGARGAGGPGESVGRFYNPDTQNYGNENRCFAPSMVWRRGQVPTLPWPGSGLCRKIREIRRVLRHARFDTRFGGTHLPRLVGMAVSMATLMPKIIKDQAKEWGLIWEVVEDADLMTTVMSLAEHLATQPTWLRLHQTGVRGVDDQQSARATGPEQRLMRSAGFTDDYAEGVKRFKRKPEHTGQ